MNHLSKFSTLSFLMVAIIQALERILSLTLNLIMFAPYKCMRESDENVTCKK